MIPVDLGASALVLVLLAGLALGVASVLVLRRFSNAAVLSRSWTRLLAHLFELRLFVEDPILVFRIQRDLLRENLHLFAAIARPCALLLLPTAALILVLDNSFSHAPLRVGQPAVVTAKCDGQLQTPPQIQVQTAALRAPYEGEVSWRILPVTQVRGRLLLTNADGSFLSNSRKTGAGSIAPSKGRRSSFPVWRRTSTPFALTEPIAAGPGVLPLRILPPAFAITYPPAVILEHSWITWFCVAYLFSALMLQSLLQLG